LKAFRLTSLLEGISYLLILSVSFDLISRDYVFTLGMTHGILFISYLLQSLHSSHKQNWPITTWLLVFLASIIPFAFIAVELYLRKQLNNASLTPATEARS